MKQAILAVSFGTTYASAEESCIRPVEAALAKANPDCAVRRAYTARIVMRRLQERGTPVPSVPEALSSLRAEGYSPITIASTHIIPGTEYDMLREAAEGCPVSEPLLANDADLSWMAALDALPEKKITIAPLMLVAGDHAHNDLAGEDDDSWKSILERRGFTVQVRMRGLGAEEAVRQRFCEKVAKVLQK